MNTSPKEAAPVTDEEYLKLYKSVEYWKDLFLKEREQIATLQQTIEALEADKIVLQAALDAANLHERKVVEDAWGNGAEAAMRSVEAEVGFDLGYQYSVKEEYLTKFGSVFTNNDCSRNVNERQIAEATIKWVRVLIVDHNNVLPILKHLDECVPAYLSQFDQTKTEGV